MRRRDALMLLVALPGAGQEPHPKKLTEQDLETLLENPQNLYFLDVREPEEIRRLGSVPGYVNIPLGQLESRLAEIPKDKFIVTA